MSILQQHYLHRDQPVEFAGFSCSMPEYTHSPRSQEGCFPTSVFMVHVNYGLSVVGMQFSFKFIFWVFNLEHSANFAILSVPKYQIPYHVLVATLLW